MTFDNALSHAIDYGKFIFQIWNYYIVLILAMIGWLVTLRSKPSTLDNPTRMLLIGSFVFISAIFLVVLEQNHAILIQQMTLVHEFAQVDAKSEILRKIYGPQVDGGLVCRLNLMSRGVVPVIVICVSWFMWFLTSHAGEASGSGKTEK
jgi:hypothetical protein